jgi:response regulator RpfG family c-di-GMP phosphodiesterase
VLVVDAEPTGASSLRRLLQPRFDVAVAHAPETALAAVARRDFVVVVVVQRSSGLGGAALVARIRRRWPYTQGFVIAGYADSETIASALVGTRAPAEIDTPWNPREVEELVREAANASYALRQGQQRRADYAARGTLQYDRDRDDADAPITMSSRRGFRWEETLGLQARDIIADGF